MKLYAARGVCLLCQTVEPHTQAAFQNALELAEPVGNRAYQLLGLWGWWMCLYLNGRYAEALPLAERFNAVAAASEWPCDRLAADRVMGISHLLLGKLDKALPYLAHAAGPSAKLPRAQRIRFLYDERTLSHVSLAHTLWFLGHPDQAMLAARQARADAQELDHPVSLCYALSEGVCTLALLTGDEALCRRRSGPWWSRHAGTGSRPGRREPRCGAAFSTCGWATKPRSTDASTLRPRTSARRSGISHSRHSSRQSPRHSPAAAGLYGGARLHQPRSRVGDGDGGHKLPAGAPACQGRNPPLRRKPVRHPCGPSRCWRRRALRLAKLVTSPGSCAALPRSQPLRSSQRRTAQDARVSARPDPGPLSPKGEELRTSEAAYELLEVACCCRLATRPGTA